MLVWWSLIIDLLSHTLVSLAPQGAPAPFFVGFTVLSSFGAGLIPAVQSLGLCIMQSRGEDDTGKLFAAFAVLQSMGQMILGVSTVFAQAVSVVTIYTDVMIASSVRPHL